MKTPRSKLETSLRRKVVRHINSIARIDDQVASVIGELGYPLPRIRDAGFSTFLSIIVSQQISTSAAQSIWERLCSTVPQLTADALLQCDPEKLREAGRSRRKIEYAIGLAEQIVSGGFSPDELGSLDDESAIEKISALRGFGRWSAEIYLMFSLQRTDVFPADDLALQLALQKLKGLREKPTGKEARELVSTWEPYRSAGSLFLWHYYRGAPA